VKVRKNELELEECTSLPTGHRMHLDPDEVAVLRVIRDARGESLSEREIARRSGLLFATVRRVRKQLLRRNIIRGIFRGDR
jgi:hypothetical protein